MMLGDNILEAKVAIRDPAEESNNQGSNKVYYPYSSTTTALSYVRYSRKRITPTPLGRDTRHCNKFPLIVITPTLGT